MVWVLCLAVLLDIILLDIAPMDIVLTECMTHSEVVMAMALMDIAPLDIAHIQCIAHSDIAHSDLAQCTAWVMVQILVTAMVFQIMLGILHPFIRAI